VTPSSTGTSCTPRCRTAFRSARVPTDRPPPASAWSLPEPSCRSCGVQFLADPVCRWKCNKICLRAGLRGLLRSRRQRRGPRTRVRPGLRRAVSLLVYRPAFRASEACSTNRVASLSKLRAGEHDPPVQFGCGRQAESTESTQQYRTRVIWTGQSWFSM
jgi:hypothetical protein